MKKRKLNRLHGVDYSKDNLFVEKQWHCLGEQYPYNVAVTVGTGRDLSRQCGVPPQRNGDAFRQNHDLCVQRGIPAQNVNSSMRKLA